MIVLGGGNDISYPDGSTMSRTFGRENWLALNVDAVRASDAPGVSTSSPIGFLAGEFIELAAFAGSLAQTKTLEISELNPNFDIGNRTAKLAAIAMHKFASAIK